MATDSPNNPRARSDAWSRAWRTLNAGIVAIVLTAPGAILLSRLTSVEWSRDWWIITGLLAVQAILTAIASWAARFLVPPTRH